jgi:N12 class adenine-specific DNA methylase
MKNWIFVFIFYCSFAGAQQIVPGDILKISADSFVGFDKFGAAYFTTGNTLSKFHDGKSLQYQNVALGKITRADLVNPLKIVLFYSNFNTVVMVDNQLNEISQVKFSELTEPIVVSATGNASQNRLWFYDSLTQRIGLYDYLSNNMVFLTQPLTGNLDYYETDFNTFQWIDEDGKRYSCDVYGKISFLGEIAEFDTIRFVSDTSVLYAVGNKIVLYNSATDETTPIKLGEKSFESFHYKDQILSIFTKEGITNYKITIP